MERDEDYFIAFSIGAKVQKVSGYRFPGEVRAVIIKRDGRIVYAVESTAPDTEGMLHIFSRAQLRLDGGDNG